MPTIYPWENASLAILSHQIFKLAQASGYTGPEDLLFRRFDAGAIHNYSSLAEFPVPGVEGDLYLDTNTYRNREVSAVSGFFGEPLIFAKAPDFKTNIPVCKSYEDIVKYLSEV